MHRGQLGVAHAFTLTKAFASRLERTWATVVPDASEAVSAAADVDAALQAAFKPFAYVPCALSSALLASSS